MFFLIGYQYYNTLQWKPQMYRSELLTGAVNGYLGVEKFLIPQKLFLENLIKSEPNADRLSNNVKLPLMSNRQRTYSCALDDIDIYDITASFKVVTTPLRSLG
jgi:hypothetical protein